MATKFGYMMQNGYLSPKKYHRTNFKSLLGNMIVLRMEASCVFKVQENVHPGIDIMASDMSADCMCCTTFVQCEDNTFVVYYNGSLDIHKRLSNDSSPILHVCH